MAKTHAAALALKTAVRSFWNTFNAIDDLFGGVVSERTSTQKTDTLARLGAAPFPQQWTGDREYKTAVELSYTVQNLPYEVSIRIDKEFIKYQQWDEIANLGANAGMKARVHRQKLHSTDLIDGNSTAGDDGQFFFDTDHKDPGAEYQTNQTNDLTAVIVDADVPTDLEFAVAVRAMKQKFFEFFDDQGDPWPVPGGNTPSNYVLMVPPLYMSVANRVLKASDLTGPVGNDLQGGFEIRVNQFLTAPTTTGLIYMLYTGNTHKALMLQRVADLRFQTREDEVSGDMLLEGDWWGRTAYGNWREAILYTFTQ